MRRRGRESALQILYQLDVGRQLNASLADHPDRVETALSAYWASFDSNPPADREFAERLVRGVVDQLETLDAALEGASQNWKLARMEKVDLNLMRIAAYEICHCPDIPRAASINEAVEIAKRFSGPEAASFVNGLLDQLAGEAKEEPT